MPLLENDQFLVELSKFFQKSRTGAGSQSVVISMKRYDGRTKPIPRTETSPSSTHADYKCLFRAHVGYKKISTVVNPKEVNKFQLAYANLLKNSMDNLKKRDRKSEATKKSIRSAKAAQ